MIEKQIKTNLVFDGKVIKVRVDDIEFSKNNEINTSKREIVIHNGGACALIKTKENKIIFVKQFRYAFNDYLLELPAGKIEKGEKAITTITREVTEEAGIKANYIHEMGYLYPSPGFCTEVIYLYYVDDYEMSNQNFDFDEEVEIVELTYTEAISLVNQNKIVDAKTVCLLYKCASFFKGC